jgi:hypothetical protein
MWGEEGQQRGIIITIMIVTAITKRKNGPGEEEACGHQVKRSVRGA